MTTEERTYEIGDRVTWPRQEGMSTGIVVQFEDIPTPLRDLLDDRFDVAVLPDGERTAIPIPRSRIDYAPPIPEGSRVSWQSQGEVRRGRVIAWAEVGQASVFADVGGVPVIEDGTGAKMIADSQGMRIVSQPEDMAQRQRQADALLAAIRTVQRAMQVVEGEGAGVTAHGAWDPSDFREGIETQGDFEATLDRINDDLRAMARMARIAGAQR